MPLVSQVVSGETADDGLYIPAIQQVQQTLRQSGLLFVGDSKMGALETRRYLHAQGHFYLCPLALTGKLPELLTRCVAQALAEPKQQVAVSVTNAEGQPEVIAQGIEVSRELSLSEGDPELTWQERVFVIHSPVQAKLQHKGLAQRLQTAQNKLMALTPAPSRGKHQITEETTLQKLAQAILTHHRVEGLLSYHYERQVSQTARFVGRGRASNRPQQIAEKVRYQITSIHRQEAAIAALEQTFGWRAYASNAVSERLSLPQTVLTYRDEWIVERGFHRLKGAPLSISPLFVRAQ